MTDTWIFKEKQFSKTSPTHVAFCRAFSLLDKIKELKAEKKTSEEGPEQLLNAMKTISEGCIRKVDRLNTELLKTEISQLERKNIENTIRAIILSVNKLHTFLRYIDATRLRRNPTGMIKPWELLIKKYNKDVNIIIRPQWKYNYSYYNIIKEFENINDIIGDNKSIEDLSKIGSYFPILSFAGLERDNVLLHIILAHEIGHLIDEMEQFSLIDKYSDEIIRVLDTTEVSEKLKKLYDLSVNIMKTSEDKSKQSVPEVSYNLFIEHEAKSQAQKELVDKICTWLEEITADIIAIRIIGPSFIFALFQTDLAHVSKKGPVGDYPPPQIRMDKCIEYWDAVDKNDKFFDYKETEEINHQKIKKCISEYLNNIKQEEPDASPKSSTISELKKERYNLLNEILKVVVKGPLDSIKDSIQGKIPLFKLDNRIFKLIELLKNRITPVYTNHDEEPPASSECDIASILNAGWIFWLTHERRLAKEEDSTNEVELLEKLRFKYYEPLVEISNLVLKGIESTDFNTQFSEGEESQRAFHKN